MEERILRMMPQLNERLLRLFLANEAMSYGREGVTLVSRMSGFSRTTITAGNNEIRGGYITEGRIRKSGGGRKRIEVQYPEIKESIRKVINEKNTEIQ